MAQNEFSNHVSQNCEATALFKKILAHESEKAGYPLAKIAVIRRILEEFADSRRIR